MSQATAESCLTGFNEASCQHKSLNLDKHYIIIIHRTFGFILNDMTIWYLNCRDTPCHASNHPSSLHYFMHCTAQTCIFTALQKTELKHLQSLQKTSERPVAFPWEKLAKEALGCR